MFDENESRSWEFGMNRDPNKRLKVLDGDPSKRWSPDFLAITEENAVIRHEQFFPNLKAQVSTLKSHLEFSKEESEFEDNFYRFYYRSGKIYFLQNTTEIITEALQAVMPDRPLNCDFLQIFKDGTRVIFSSSHPDDIFTRTRPIIEAYLHARAMLELAVKYGEELDEYPTGALPYGFAALLCFYDLR